MPKRILNMSVLPGEPLDGSGRCCIHLFIQDPKGIITEPHVLHRAPGDSKELIAKPTRGRLACDPRRTVAPATTRGIITVTLRTDDPRSVTCPKCIASAGYADLMKQLER